jgi:hypothetical protein
VCEAFWFVKNKTLTKDLERVIQEANAGTRFIVNALHRNSTEPNKVIQLELPYKVGTSLFGDGKGSAGLLSQWMSLTMRGLPLDINVGTDIIIRRTGTGINTNYVVELPNDISQPVPPQVLDELIDLNELVKGWQHTDEEERKAIAAIRDIGIIADSLAGVHQQPLAQPTQVWSPAPQPIATAPQAQAAPVPQATSSYYMPPLTTNQINPNDDVFKGTVTDGGMSMEEIQAMLAGTGMAPMASNV